MPAYPHPPHPDARPSGSARVRAGMMRGLAHVAGGRSGRALSPQELTAARILVIRPDHLGDLLFLGPALRWLRTRLPHTHITLAIGPWGKAALPGLIGAYDQLIELSFPAFERGTRAGAAARWWMLGTWANRLRAEAFDAAFIARPDHWWGAMLARFAGIPLRLGFNTPETTPWLTRALPTAQEHAVASNLRLVAALTGDALKPSPIAHPLRFQLTPHDFGDADRLLFDIFGMDNVHPLAIIHPGSGAAIKLWEAGKWREVARRLAHAGMRVLITGGPGETALTREVAAASADNVVDVGGRTSFAVLAALLQRADIVMGPDSGPLHLAVAVGTPSLHLYGPSDPVLFGPWSDPARHIVIASDWSCAPCGKFDWPDLPAHNCVRDITVERVWEAVEQLVGMTADR